MTADPIPPELSAPTTGLDPHEVELAVDLILSQNSTQPIPHPMSSASRAYAWRIEDDNSAEWAMRHVAAANREIADAEAKAQHWVEQVTDWLTAQRRRPAAKIVFFENHLNRYQRARREADPTAKTLSLPSGVVRSTMHADTVKIVGKDAYVAWAETNAPETLKAHPQPVADKVQDRFKIKDGQIVDATTGEVAVVPGLMIEPEHLTVKVAPA
jgi:hypothetical protein